MIEVTRLHGAGSLLINADLIETVEACPDTTITLVTKRRFVVADALVDVIRRVEEYHARIAAGAGMSGDHAAGARAAFVHLENDKAA